MSVRDYLKGVCVRVRDEHGVDVEIRRLGAAMADTRTLRQPMLDLVAELSERYTLAVLTNNVAENRDHLASTLPLDHFDFVLNSADVGVRKPDPLIYRELLRRLGCAGSEVVYIDDFAENLPPAADLGMATIEFTDPDDLRRRLASWASESRNLIGKPGGRLPCRPYRGQLVGWFRHGFLLRSVPAQPAGHGSSQGTSNCSLSR
ncbi:HAD family phosphatase [Gordonia westfalica]|uniref:HAD family phosphatase n=1 Tax=Gordonia westfalica TaxID=158898 RepID=A0ABU2GWB0_9ACTN|nr:HAD family phosphatase [Gordonia westfalica]MDS1115763.1 HAD family phosphatase [Gordonia westfalica]